MNILKDLLFPKKCVTCRALGTYLCISCERRIEWKGAPVCLVCRRPSPAGATHTSCAHITPLDAYSAVWRYNTIMKVIIKKIKYRLVQDAFDDLFQIACRGLGPRIADFRTVLGDFSFVPVPLHSRRMRERGFNQAELIAKRLHAATGIPITHILERVRYTAPQASLTHAKDRHANITEAFRIRPDTPVSGRSYLLVDDLITSGSTTGEAARVLKSAGARRVAAFALAQG